MSMIRLTDPVNMYSLCLILGICFALTVQSLVVPVPVADNQPSFCVNGTECTENECCLQYDAEGIAVGRRSFIDNLQRGVCERLGHYNSDCHRVEPPIPSGKPEGLVRGKACPCQSLYTCTEADIGPGLGICV